MPSVFVVARLDSSVAWYQRDLASVVPTGPTPDDQAIHSRSRNSVVKQAPTPADPHCRDELLLCQLSRAIAFPVIRDQGHERNGDCLVIPLGLAMGRGERAQVVLEQVEGGAPWVMPRVPPRDTDVLA
jgi:hypothetical protein